jgi:hypothetical protein
MARFREHRGTLAESLATAVAVHDRAELIDYLRKILAPYPVEDEIVVKFYAHDDRISEDLFAVTVPGYGLIGFIDSDLRP